MIAIAIIFGFSLIGLVISGDLLVPNPTSDPMACGHDKPSFLCDPDRLFNQTVDNTYDKIVNDIMATTKNFSCPGFLPNQTSSLQVASAWIKGPMILEPGEQLQDATKRYAMTIHNQWGIGNRECNNDIICVNTRPTDVYEHRSGYPTGCT